VLPAARGIRLVGVTVSNFVETEAKEQTADSELPIFMEDRAA